MWQGEEPLNLIRNMDDKGIRDVDSVLSRVEHFWIGHGIKDVTKDVGHLAEKSIGVIRNRGSVSAVNGNLSIPFEGGLSGKTASRGYDALAAINTHKAAFNSNPLFDSEIRSDLNTLRPIDIIRHTPEPLKNHGVWSEYDNKLRGRLRGGGTSLPHNEAVNRIHEVIDLAQSSPKTASLMRSSDRFTEEKYPHALSGQFMKVSTPDGASMYGRSDVIDLRTGSWARLNKDRTGYDVF